MLDPATERTYAVDHTTNEHLGGVFEPVTDEIEVSDLPVRGDLPAGLEGTYVRNGPNPEFAPLGSYTHPFDGDGMLHAITFEAGRVRYRNRWVVTKGLVAERRTGHALYGGLFTPVVPDSASIGVDGERSIWKTCANTNVVRHAGRLLALGTTGLPYELTPGFGTIGEFDDHGRLPGGMAPYPKVDPVWDELCWYRIDLDAPHLVYGVIGPRGDVTRTVQVDIPRPVLMPDFAVTDQHVVFFDAPAVLDPGAVGRGEAVVQWREELGTRLGVLPRDGDTNSVRWFPIDHRFVPRVANAFTAGDEIVIDYIHRRQPALPGAELASTPRLYRSVVDLGRGTVSDELLDSRAIGLPRIDERRTGLSYRYLYAAAVTHAGGGPLGADYDALVKVDLQTRAVTEHRVAEGIVVGEPVFVPRPGSSDEDDGWILALTYDTTRDASELLVLAPDDLGGPALAAVPLPRRVPAGLSGTWLPAAG